MKIITLKNKSSRAKKHKIKFLFHEHEDFANQINYVPRYQTRAEASFTLILLSVIYQMHSLGIEWRRDEAIYQYLAVALGQDNEAGYGFNLDGSNFRKINPIKKLDYIESFTEFKYKVDNALKQIMKNGLVNVAKHGSHNLRYAKNFEIFPNQNLGYNCENSNSDKKKVHLRASSPKTLSPSLATKVTLLNYTDSPIKEATCKKLSNTGVFPYENYIKFFFNCNRSKLRIRDYNEIFKKGRERIDELLLKLKNLINERGYSRTKRIAWYQECGKFLDEKSDKGILNLHKQIYLVSKCWSYENAVKSPELINTVLEQMYEKYLKIENTLEKRNQKYLNPKPKPAKPRIKKNEIEEKIYNYWLTCQNDYLVTEKYKVSEEKLKEIVKSRRQPAKIKETPKEIETPTIELQSSLSRVIFEFKRNIMIANKGVPEDELNEAILEYKIDNIREIEEGIFAPRPYGFKAEFAQYLNEKNMFMEFDQATQNQIEKILQNSKIKLNNEPLDKFKYLAGNILNAFKC